MVSDATTFFLAFLAVFGGLGAYLVWLQRRAKQLGDRLAALEAAKPKDPQAPKGPP